MKADAEATDAAHMDVGITNLQNQKARYQVRYLALLLFFNNL